MGKKVFTQTVQSPTDMELELELELDRGSICKNLIWLLGAQKVEWNCTNGGSRTHWLCPMPIHHPAPRTVQGSCLSRTRRGGEGGKGSSLLGLAPTCPGTDLPARSLAQLPVLPRLASASRSMSSDGTCCEFPPCWERCLRTTPPSPCLPPPCRGRRASAPLWGIRSADYRRRSASPVFQISGSRRCTKQNREQFDLDTFDRLQERAGLLVKRDSLTPPRKGLLNQNSVEEDEVGGLWTIHDMWSGAQVVSKQSTPDIRLEFWDIAELSPLSTPSATPAHSRSPSPFDLRHGKSFLGLD